MTHSNGRQAQKGQGRRRAGKKVKIEEKLRARRSQGQPFPTEHEIAAEFEVSVRYAKLILSELRAEMI